ncbi:hypothetical protein ASPZODRAFT_1407385 [Penicilliopsis zonata CBS 506.65]|uniref:Uncharacterized protein n=1 Tax=Penicilliopsis zonata CBS 506.65 TaxID=1073090 RepID=A0A1L9SPW9_9EURO|nr:hypothetical protein ASPZODRAFT_1407385 [Penicilliopsis zonata CBS 506.65]OJJ49151.1 hypothetical protein ASPZODRAFT_1407385 [Penicilliopsis zonata CBS 506.65]
MCSLVLVICFLAGFFSLLFLFHREGFLSDIEFTTPFLSLSLLLCYSLLNRLDPLLSHHSAYSFFIFYSWRVFLAATAQSMLVKLVMLTFIVHTLRTCTYHYSTLFLTRFCTF